MNLSGASVQFTAHHFDAVLEEGWHEHTWTVTVWWPMVPWRDGRSMREGLAATLESFITLDDEGRRCLPVALWSNEALARQLRPLANIAKINVDRPGFHAEVWV